MWGELIEKIWETDPAAHSRLEIALFYPGFHALLFHGVAHWLWQKNIKILALMIAYYSRMITGVEIHPGASIGRRVFIDHGMGVVIGETAVIGDDVLIYHGVTLGASTAAYMGAATRNRKRHPTIGDGVIIGSGANILGDIKIGTACRISAGAIITDNVPANSLVIAEPSKIIAREAKAVG